MTLTMTLIASCGRLHVRGEGSPDEGWRVTLEDVARKPVRISRLVGGELVTICEHLDAAAAKLARGPTVPGLVPLHAEVMS